MKKALILGFVAIAGAASAQNIVANSAFSADAYPANSYVSTKSVTDWTVNTFAQGQEVAGTGVGYLGQSEQMIDLSGANDVYTPSGQSATLSQTLTTIAGDTYEYSFDVYTGANLGYSGGVDFSVDGKVYQSDVQSLAASSSVVNISGSFLATGNDTISFDSNHGIVSQIGKVSVEAVPEPVSMVTLGVGLVGLMKRRKK